MNAVEIEEAVSRLAEQPFDAEGFPYAFLEAFGNKPTTIQRLRSGNSNQSDLGGLLQRSNIHIKVCAPGGVAATLKALRESPKTAAQKAKFVLATDGIELQAEALEGEGETLACDYPKFADHFGFFLPLAGISTVRQIRENAFDIKATGRLNRLYVELLKDNPEWGTAARREELNHFMARVIFCFFAEDTNIFHSESLFTATVEQMSARDSSNTHEVISELFRAMNTRLANRGAENIRPWANLFPYVNGGLFNGSVDVPKFSKIARSYLLHVGNLDWTKINPDIFGSMIQAVADDEERGALGMHYTSVPNILKVLNPLFLDDLRAKLEEAGNNPRKLHNLRQRIARIRVFDPACGSGNFLVIAYKELRAIEAEINRRRGEAEIQSALPLTNFRGIELRHFSCEIARLALIIAEYQCDVLYRGQQLALAEFLPLEAANWITCGNALRLDWLSICPPTSKGVKLRGDDLFETPLDQAEIDFANEGGETYICGNPPYVGDKKQSKAQKEDMRLIFESLTKKWRSLDYVSAWFMKAADYGKHTPCSSAFVATNSVNQGQQVPVLWPSIFDSGHKIIFAHSAFKWANLAAHNAGVTVVIIGISNRETKSRLLFSGTDGGEISIRNAENINAYLAAAPNIFVHAKPRPISDIAEMLLGNFAKDGGNLICEHDGIKTLDSTARKFLRPMFGGAEFIKGLHRYCFWIRDEDLAEAYSSPELCERFQRVKANRLSSPKAATAEWSTRPHRFVEIRSPDYDKALIVPIVSSENRAHLPVGFLPDKAIVNYAFALYDAPLWNMAIIASKLHLAWIGTVCGKMKTDYRYSNTLGWNTFPVPPLTERNKADLTRCAEEILLAREAHFPATIADLYDPEKMPADLRAAHDRNDETLERIYIGRRFKNDTERLEKLFELYTKMTAHAPAKKAVGRRKA
jgi:hypothetical protein